MNKPREDGALKPIGLALTAVVAGLGAAAAGAQGAAATIASTADATRDPVRHEALRSLAGAPVEPFAPETQQPDLFEL